MAYQNKNSELALNFNKKLIFGFVLAFLVAVTFGITSAQHGNNVSGNLFGYYSKDQCKNGGWEALGFSNQGQCVAFFASGGRVKIKTKNNANINVNNESNQSSSSGNATSNNNTEGGNAASGNASNSNSASTNVNISF